MSWALGLGLVSTALGYDASKDAAKASKKADQRALDIQQEALDFSKQQYEDWKAIYGPIEQNLADFYGNLTPEYIESQGLQAQQKAYQQQVTQLEDYFAASGIESGVEADMMTKLAMENTRNKAQISADAPFQVAEQQQSFLALGLGQKASTQSAVTNQMTNLASTYSNQADTYAGYSQAGAEAMWGGLETVADELDAMTTTANKGETEIM